MKVQYVFLSVPLHRHSLELKFIYNKLKNLEKMEFYQLCSECYGTKVCVKSKFFGTRLQIYLYLAQLNRTWGIGLQKSNMNSYVKKNRVDCIIFISFLFSFIYLGDVFLVYGCPNNLNIM